MAVDRREAVLAGLAAWAGATVSAVVAGHPLHHTPRDLPDVTDGAMLEPVARGLQTMLAAT